MRRVLITGSSDGLGLMAGQLLVDQGHGVTFHARSSARAAELGAAVPGARDIVVGDLSTVAGMWRVAEQANALGRYDSVIHNAAVGYRTPRRVETEDGLAELFAINVLAPYALTALVAPPERLVYLGSAMHRGGNPRLDDLNWTARRWNGSQAYADSKFLDVLLAFAVARRWPGVRSNAVEPGWVATKMGGPGAPDDLSLGPVTQAWLAASDAPAAATTAGYFYHQRPKEPHPATRDLGLQEELLARCAQLAGVDLPPAR